MTMELKNWFPLLYFYSLKAMLTRLQSFEDSRCSAAHNHGDGQGGHTKHMTTAFLVYIT